ncbi:MAG TPA: hypothetical protein VFJ52_10035, partial [Terriglobia bacterium]|nr:hypothetical protein [Terriglobia bacterium]
MTATPALITAASPAVQLLKVFARERMIRDFFKKFLQNGARRLGFAEADIHTSKVEVGLIEFRR